MKVNSNSRDISFNGFYNSPALKKSLEFAADNGALFAATTTLTLSLTARPAVILATPKTDKENKKLAFAKSLASTFTGYALMFALSKPLAKKMKTIDKELTKESVENLKDEAETLAKSKAYILATQMFKLGLGLAAAIPKAILTAACVPVVMNNIFPQNNELLDCKNEDKTANPAFKGISKVLNNKKYQEFAKKYKNSNFPMHIIAATDAVTTTTFIHQINKNKNISEERKKPLCFNTGISTALSILSSYFADSLTNKPMAKFIEKFKTANQNSPKLDKYLEGIKIAKPILIIGGIYYIIIPLISTFLADRSDKLLLLGDFGRSNTNNKRNDN